MKSRGLLLHVIWLVLSGLATQGVFAQQGETENSSSFKVRYEFVGVKFADGSVEDCPDVRTHGRETIAANLELTEYYPEDGFLRYEGEGRASADIDGCGMTPNREDPGMVHDRGGEPGTFEGDNFLGCVVTARAAEHDVQVSLEVSLDEDGVPMSARLDWEPVRPDIPVDVSAACEADYAADYIRNSRDGYRSGGSLEVLDPELLATMIDDGTLVAGRYQDPWPLEYGAWTLTVGDVVPDPVQVAIKGPACDCLEAESAEGNPLRFTASASRAGGRFTEFRIGPTGDAPRLISNEGGAEPSLEFVAAPKTGSVTLSITYELDGRRYAAPDFQVSFCVMEPIELKDDVHDLSFDSSSRPRVDVAASSRAWLNGTDISPQLEWTLEEIPAPTVTAPGNATGARVSLGYEGLPQANGDFGKRTITAMAEGSGCACSREEIVRIFFPPDAVNHPPGDAGTGVSRDADPNWFFYWLQTPAAEAGDGDLDRVRYQKYIPPHNNPDDKVSARYVPNPEDVLLVSERVRADDGCRGRVVRETGKYSGQKAKGIDCFAEQLRHEASHRTDWQEWWPNGYKPLSDPDMDTVPMSVELKEPGCSNTSKKSCNGRPFPDATDLEFAAYWVGWQWPIGSADTSDWSCDGKQWGGGNCPK